MSPEEAFDDMLVRDAFGNRMPADPREPLGVCGVCYELHNKCSRLDWREEAPF